MMEAKKEIKVYGTLVNHTLDESKSNDLNSSEVGHNDALAYAKQLFDDRFNTENVIDKYQDNINKRVTNIKYDPETGNTIIEGDLIVDGVEINLLDLLERIEKLEKLWHLSNGKVVSGKDDSNQLPVVGAKFFDSTITQ